MPEFKEAYENEEVTRELIDTAFILEDLTRNASVHAAGVVIGAGAAGESAAAQAGRKRHASSRNTRWVRSATSAC